MSTDCDGNTYGQNCTQTCGLCINGEQCDAVNGQCPNGCQPGFQPPLCSSGIFLHFVILLDVVSIGVAVAVTAVAAVAAAAA